MESETSGRCRETGPGWACSGRAHGYAGRACGYVQDRLAVGLLGEWPGSTVLRPRSSGPIAGGASCQGRCQSPCLRPAALDARSGFDDHQDMAREGATGVLARMDNLGKLEC